MYPDLYTDTLPEALRRMAATPAMQRLARVGMHCGCEYAAFPIYRNAKAPYSRLTHSVGTAAIVWHFTGELRQAAAALLHDIATPSFAHVVDFLNGDHLRQESTEARTHAMIAASPELMALLAENGLTLTDVDDYHRYPIADNDSPRLSADRLEYTLGNACRVFHAPEAEIRAICDDLFVGQNEAGEDELCFAQLDAANAFTRLALRQSQWFVSDDDRFSMQYLADLLHAARRVWKLRLGRCSLSALEDKIYHEPRVDDLSGAEVPQRYFDYLKSHDMSLLEDILRHNAQDIATLARLTYTLSSLHDNPLSAEHTQDIFSLGRVCERGGQLERARVCYRAADSGVMSALCRERLADTLRREHSDAEAAAIYEKMIAARQGGAQPYIALAKLLEHRLHDVNKAANIARKGLLYLTDRPSLSPREQVQLDDLTRRCARLLQKQSRQS